MLRNIQEKKNPSLFATCAADFQAEFPTADCSGSHTKAHRKQHNGLSNSSILLLPGKYMFVSACRNSCLIIRVYRFHYPRKGMVMLTEKYLTVHFTLLCPSPLSPESELALDVLQICSGSVTCALLKVRDTAGRMRGVRLSWHSSSARAPLG